MNRRQLSKNQTLQRIRPKFHDEKHGICSPAPRSLEMGGELEWEVTINHALSLHKIPKGPGLESFQVGEDVEVPGERST